MDYRSCTRYESCLVFYVAVAFGGQQPLMLLPIYHLLSPLAAVYKRSQKEYISDIQRKNVVCSTRLMCCLVQIILLATTKVTFFSDKHYKNVAGHNILKVTNLASKKGSRSRLRRSVALRAKDNLPVFQSDRHDY